MLQPLQFVRNLRTGAIGYTTRPGFVDTKLTTHWWIAYPNSDNFKKFLVPEHELIEIDTDDTVPFVDMSWITRELDRAKSTGTR